MLKKSHYRLQSGCGWSQDLGCYVEQGRGEIIGLDFTNDGDGIAALPIDQPHLKTLLRLGTRSAVAIYALLLTFHET